MLLEQYSSEEMALIAKELSKTYGPYKRIGAEITFEDGTPTDQEIEEAILPILKKVAYSYIDVSAGIARKALLTLEPGQESIYQWKIEEAIVGLNDNNPDFDNYPFLRLEVGITGPTIADISAKILAKADAVKQAAAAIEGKRITYKNQVTNATNKSEIDAITDVVSY